MQEYKKYCFCVLILSLLALLTYELLNFVLTSRKSACIVIFSSDIRMLDTPIPLFSELDLSNYF